MLDKPKVHALLVSGAVALLLYALSLVPIVLAEQPNTARAIARAAVEKGLVAAISVLAGAVSRPWSADLINALIGFSPVKIGVQVDVVTSTSLIVALTSILVGNPDARAKVIRFVGGLIPGGAK